MKKNIKRIFVAFSILFVIFIVTILYFLFIFEMFPVHKEELAKIEIPSKNYSLIAYYIDSGASSNYFIQIQKVYESGNFEILKNIEGYRYLKDFKLLQDNNIQIVLEHDIRFNTTYDTVIIGY